MAQPLALLAIQLTVSAKANLLAALQVVNPAAGAFMAAASQLILQGDPGNSSNNVLIGDDSISSTNYGYACTATGQPLCLYSNRGSDIPISNMWILNSGGSPKLNVLILP